MTYKDAYLNVKNGPWFEFFNTQDLDSLMDMLDNSSKTIYPSPENIFKELKNDLGIKRNNTDLSDWHEQGVFLLNSSLIS